MKNLANDQITSIAQLIAHDQFLPCNRHKTQHLYKHCRLLIRSNFGIHHHRTPTFDLALNQLRKSFGRCGRRGGAF